MASPRGKDPKEREMMKAMQPFAQYISHLPDTTAQGACVVMAHDMIQRPETITAILRHPQMIKSLGPVARLLCNLRDEDDKIAGRTQALEILHNIATSVKVAPQLQDYVEAQLASPAPSIETRAKSIEQEQDHPMTEAPETDSNPQTSERGLRRSKRQQQGYSLQDKFTVPDNLEGSEAEEDAAPGAPAPPAAQDPTQSPSKPASRKKTTKKPLEIAGAFGTFDTSIITQQLSTIRLGDNTDLGLRINEQLKDPVIRECWDSKHGQEMCFFVWQLFDRDRFADLYTSLQSLFRDPNVTNFEGVKLLRQDDPVPPGEPEHLTKVIRQGSLLRGGPIGTLFPILLQCEEEANHYRDWAQAVHQFETPGSEIHNFITDMWHKHGKRRGKKDNSYFVDYCVSRSSQTDIEDPAFEKIKDKFRKTHRVSETAYVFSELFGSGVFCLFPKAYRTLFVDTETKKWVSLIRQISFHCPELLRGTTLLTERISGYLIRNLIPEYISLMKLSKSSDVVSTERTLEYLMGPGPKADKE